MGDTVSYGTLLWGGVGSAPAAAIDTTPPVVENLSPTPGTPIGSLDPVTFAIFEAVGIRRIFVTALFTDGTHDVVHDGDAFGPKYAGISSRTVVGTRTFFVVRRRRGFPTSPTIKIFPIDTSGNEG